MQAFDQNLAGWREWQDAPWGRLRYTVASHNLARHLPPGPSAVLDVAGGNGLDAVPLAQAGHQVTVLDFSQEMLNGARRLAEEHGVLERMTFRLADVAKVRDLFPADAFDVVLCHNLIQYVDDVDAVLVDLAYLLRPQGVLSLIAGNGYAYPLITVIRDGDPAKALDVLDAPTAHTELFDVAVRRYASEDLLPALIRAGLEQEAQYGIRCVNDWIIDNECKEDAAFFAALERLELALSARYPYYLLARMFHIIARKEVQSES